MLMKGTDKKEELKSERQEEVAGRRIEGRDKGAWQSKKKRKGAWFVPDGVRCRKGLYVLKKRTDNRWARLG
jgi:hypothetical protein